MDQAMTPRIRTVALVGQSGSGKTTLAEALLHRAGVVTRAGRVEDGSTVTDHEPEEIARGLSLGLAVAPFPWRAPDGLTYDVTLLDTPGTADFAGAVDAALAVADLALVVVSAVDGVQAGTHQAWKAAAEAGIPRMVVVTKEDKARADFRHVLADLREAFGEGLVALELPLGEEQAFGGVADVLSEEPWEYAPRRHPSRGHAARRPGRRGAPAARGGHRGDRRARRRPARAVPVRRRAHGRRARAHARARGAGPARRSPCSSRPG